VRIMTILGAPTVRVAHDGRWGPRGLSKAYDPAVWSWLDIRDGRGQGRLRGLGASRISKGFEEQAHTACVATLWTGDGGRFSFFFLRKENRGTSARSGRRVRSPPHVKGPRRIGCAGFCKRLLTPSGRTVPGEGDPTRI